MVRAAPALYGCRSIGGDAGALADVVERTEKMAEAMVPLVTEYFEHRQTGDT